MNISTRSVYFCIASVVCLLFLSGSPKCQECLATGDVDCDGNFTGGDLSDMLGYLLLLYDEPECPVEGDMTADCILDWRDFDGMLYCMFLADPGPCFAPPTSTCCDPMLIYLSDTIRPLGNSSVIMQDGNIVANDIGATGGDGVRVYPNMGGLWQPKVSSSLSNISLTDEGAEAKFSFTGAGIFLNQWPHSSRVDTGCYLDPAVVAEVTNAGGQVELAVDFLDDDISEFGLAFFVAGAMSGSHAFEGKAAGLSGDIQSGELAVTGLSLALSDSTVLTIQLDRSIEFSIDGQSPPVTFWADELRFATVNVIQPTVGVGPFDITAANIDWFGVSFPTCCEDRVGDANGIGGDEPTIGDVSVMIDAKFISGECEGRIACLAEADWNQSGGCNPTCDDISIGDVAWGIDYLFGTWEWFPVPSCIDCP